MLNDVKHLSRDVMNMKRTLEEMPDLEDVMLGADTTLHRFIPRKWDQVKSWDFFNDKLVFQTPPKPSRRTLSIGRHLAIKHIIMTVSFVLI